MSESDELSELEIALYRSLLTAPGLPTDQVAAALGRAVEELDKPINRLTEMGLVRPQGTVLQAISPMLAEATALGAEDLELAARRAMLEARRNTIRRLVPEWNAALNDGTQVGWLSAVWAPGVLAGNAADTAGKWKMAPMPQWDPAKPPTGNWGGSAIAVTHATNDYDPEMAKRAEAVYRKASHQMHYRARPEVEALLAGYDLVEPGLVDMIHWRPDGEPSADPLGGDVARYSGYAAVGRKHP